MVIPRWRVTLGKEHSDLRYLERCSVILVYDRIYMKVYDY